MISLPDQGMNNRRLQQLIEQVGTINDGQLGFWRFTYQGSELYAITDESHNRMRIMTAIITEDEVTDEDRKIMLAANFDRALDAKFATAQGHLWSVFIHPLKELTESQFFDAVAQVKTLADNYGTTYSSSELVFGGGDPHDAEPS